MLQQNHKSSAKPRLIISSSTHNDFVEATTREDEKNNGVEKIFDFDPSAPPSFTVGEIRAAIPGHCWVKSPWKVSGICGQRCCCCSCVGCSCCLAQQLGCMAFLLGF
ncbi:hypothetical protein Sjap_000969 [Stephania japonica]|uniref:Fatty acid desaturase N-terminal domain-containing protein n=1 Tax=Stephania japonica TaxID=461633 RepID=A0AAP0PT20_9MAGN